MPKLAPMTSAPRNALASSSTANRTYDGKYAREPILRTEYRFANLAQDARLAPLTLQVRRQPAMIELSGARRRTLSGNTHHSGSLLVQETPRRAAIDPRSPGPR